MNSAMNLFYFLLYIPLVHSASHTFMTTCTGLKSQAVAGTPKISALTTLDGKQIDYYDSDKETLIPKQDWMKEFASGDAWKRYIKVRERVQQVNKMTVLMEQFSQSHGVHMYQRVYGCVWDDETKVSDGIDQYRYDGVNVISLDLKEGRYTALVPQADSTVVKWNNDREQLDFLKQYYKHECIDWLKEILHVQATFKKTGIVTELSGQSLTEPTEKNLSVDDTEGSGSSLDVLYMYAAIGILVTLILLLLYVLWRKR
ncbi:major histocompatibility complex class I-related gene protein-like, partial [Garra rufa]|uniref:major histocompatibility complex class I-related gene protein-like n=1 Tax=Garra rufa TaxID=137080 RepID=UPI003CCEB5C7